MTSFLKYFRKLQLRKIDYEHCKKFGVSHRLCDRRFHKRLRRDEHTLVLLLRISQRFEYRCGWTIRHLGHEGVSRGCVRKPPACRPVSRLQGNASCRSSQPWVLRNLCVDAGRRPTPDAELAGWFFPKYVWGRGFNPSAHDYLGEYTTPADSASLVNNHSSFWFRVTISRSPVHECASGFLLPGLDFLYICDRKHLS